jgi:hypothetical protein
MVRLRNALLAGMLATAVGGCSHTHDYAHFSIFHCSECDDFPVPSYGPQTMVPGSYTGPPPQSSTPPSRMVTPPSSNAPVTSEEAIVPPPSERPTAPPTTPPAETSMPTPTPPTPPSAEQP